jgi:hypothetical protein
MLYSLEYAMTDLKCDTTQYCMLAYLLQRMFVMVLL